MATEILRPNSGNVSIQGNNYTIAPSSVTDYYILINETIADDDSTCITLTKTDASVLGSNNSIAICFDSEDLRKNYSQIVSARFVCRTKIDTDHYFILRLIGINAQSNEFSEASYDIVFNELGWSTTYLDIDLTNITTTIDSWLEYDNTLPPIKFLFTGRNTDKSAAKTSCECSITQAYLEITYTDTLTTETIYLKENGSWTSIPCTIYQKQNGAWVTTDSSILENGDKFILQEVT